MTGSITHSHPNSVSGAATSAPAIATSDARNTTQSPQFDVALSGAGVLAGKLVSVTVSSSAPGTPDSSSVPKIVREIATNEMLRAHVVQQHASGQVAPRISFTPLNHDGAGSLVTRPEGIDALCVHTAAETRARDQIQTHVALDEKWVRALEKLPVTVTQNASPVSEQSSARNALELQRIAP